jgi:hypothetical protein
MIAALFVETGGAYYGLPGVDPWDKERDARLYTGPDPVVAHPPCERWGRYWGGGPMLAGTPRQKKLGDDAGCFVSALWSSRQFGGVLEHPEASHAFRVYGLGKPPRTGGWVRSADDIGWICCVEQGHYGHRARKKTWLYCVNFTDTRPEPLLWGPALGDFVRLDDGFHSKVERRRAIRTGVLQRLSHKQCAATPPAFRDVLLRITENCRH